MNSYTVAARFRLLLITGKALRWGRLQRAGIRGLLILIAMNRAFTGYSKRSCEFNAVTSPWHRNCFRGLASTLRRVRLKMKSYVSAKGKNNGNGKSQWRACSNQ
jgi:hypothetical protein